MPSSSKTTPRVLTKEDAAKLAEEWEKRTTDLLDRDDENFWNDEQESLYKGLVRSI